MSATDRSRAARRWRAPSKQARPFGLIDLAGAVLCALSGGLAVSALLARQVWAADVVNLFRPYAVLASVLVVLACLATRRASLILIAAALLAAELALLATPSLQGDGHPKGSSGGPVLTVITFNCLASNPSSRTAVAWIRRMHPDILVLEELPPAWAPALDTLADVLPYRASQLQPTPSDTDIFTRAPMTSADAYRPAPDLRTLIHAVVTLQGRRVQVFGIHPNTLQTPAEWENRNNALELSAQWVRQNRQSDPTLVLGDWNTPPWSPYFHAFLNISGLKSADGVFWPPVTRVLGAPLGVRVGSPIDHIAASADIGVEGCAPGPELGSDHVAQVCRIRLGPAT